jgi:hypothetical protein
MMGETIIIEQEGPLSVHRDEYSRYYFCCTDCNAQIECEGGRRQAEDLLDSHDCADVA